MGTCTIWTYIFWTKWLLKMIRNTLYLIVLDLLAWLVKQEQLDLHTSPTTDPAVLTGPAVPAPTPGLHIRYRPLGTYCPWPFGPTRTATDSHRVRLRKFHVSVKGIFINFYGLHLNFISNDETTHTVRLIHSYWLSVLLSETWVQQLLLKDLLALMEFPV